MWSVHGLIKKRVSFNYCLLSHPIRHFTNTLVVTSHKNQPLFPCFCRFSMFASWHISALQAPCPYDQLTIKDVDVTSQPKCW